MAKREHDRYASQILSTRKEVPSSVEQAEEILGSLAQTGLPGKEQIGQTISDQVARSYGQAQEALGSYPDVFSFLTELQTKEAAGLTNLEVQDQQARVANLRAFTEFLTNVKTPVIRDIEQFNIDKILAAGRERMAGTAEMMEGASRGIGGALQVAGQDKYLDYLQDKLKQQKSFFDYYTEDETETGEETSFFPFNNIYDVYDEDDAAWNMFSSFGMG